MRTILKVLIAVLVMSILLNMKAVKKENVVEEIMNKKQGEKCKYDIECDKDVCVDDISGILKCS
jgi:hypothetical protein